MAREKWVTRTVTAKRAVALCLNVITAEPHNEDFLIPNNLKDETEMLKYLRKVYENETEKICSIVSVNEETKRYGMLERDFIAAAKELDPLDKTDDENESEE